MSWQLGSSRTDRTYVFDEPIVGLHPHDIARMNDRLPALRDKGNAMLVAEHKPEAIEIPRPRGQPDPHQRAPVNAGPSSIALHCIKLT